MTDALFVRRLLVTLGLVALAVGLAGLVVSGSEVLLLVFAGILMALFLRGLARLVHTYTALGEKAALVAVVLGLVALLGVGGWFVAPPLAEQGAQLAEQVPHAVTRLRERLAHATWGRVLLAQVPDPQVLARSLLAGRAGGTVAATLGAVVGSLANVVVVLFIGLYVAASPDVYRRGVLYLVPPDGHRRTRAVLDRLGTTLQRWLVGKAIGMIVIGVLTSVGLTIIGVPLGLALGAVAGLLNFIPYLGPVLSFLPAALLASMQSPAMLGWVLLLYVVIQGLESYVITPLIQQEAVALPPGLIISVQVLLGVTLGGLGLVLATPLTACVVVVLDELYGRPRAAKPVASRSA